MRNFQFDSNNLFFLFLILFLCFFFILFSHNKSFNLIFGHYFLFILLCFILSSPLGTSRENLVSSSSSTIGAKNLFHVAFSNVIKHICVWFPFFTANSIKTYLLIYISCCQLYKNLYKRTHLLIYVLVYT